MKYLVKARHCDGTPYVWQFKQLYEAVDLIQRIEPLRIMNGTYREFDLIELHQLPDSADWREFQKPYGKHAPKQEREGR